MSNILNYFGKMKQTSITNNTWTGPCPVCGGRDRMQVWPNQDRTGRYYCRQCGIKGDGIHWLRIQYGMSYAEACAALGVTPEGRSNGWQRQDGHAQIFSFPYGNAAREKPKATAHREKWAVAARRTLEMAQANMEDRPDALCALAARYITPATARACGIGWISADQYPRRAAWGIADYTTAADGKTHSKLLVPRGILIATQRAGDIIAMQCRCPDDRPQERQRYMQIKGSANVPYIAGDMGCPVVLVESALDAALIWQESYGMVTGVATNGSYKDFDNYTCNFVNLAPIIIASPDNDNGGGIAYTKWQELFPERLYLNPACGGKKDIGDMHKAALQGERLPPIPYWINMVMQRCHYDLRIPV